jgi:hypothetical protein
VKEAAAAFHDHCDELGLPQEWTYWWCIYMNYTNAGINRWFDTFVTSSNYKIIK